MGRWGRGYGRGRVEEGNKEEQIVVYGHTTLNMPHPINLICAYNSKSWSLDAVPYFLDVPFLCFAKKKKSDSLFS